MGAPHSTGTASRPPDCVESAAGVLVVRKLWFLALCAVVAVLAFTALLVVDLRVRSASSRLPERGAVAERVPGCPSPTEVLFDPRGIAHVRAKDESALWFALGYLHARDRFFQMDLARRTAKGTLSELVGPKGLPSDRSMRTWRIAAAAQAQASRLEAGERWVLEAYSGGVNAALARHGRWISPEIWLSGLDPQPWTAEDCLSLGLLYHLAMSPAMGEELERAVELARLGRERVVELWGWSEEEADRWIPPAPPISTPRQPDEPITPEFSVIGSNSWAVGPARSATGRPLLANDPHLGVSLPGAFYAVHLEAPELHCAGLTMPGAPGIVAGHNERVAWGVTNAHLDDQDLYVLTLDDTRSAELIDGRLQDLRTVTERVAVRWREEPEVLKILISERGPVVRERGREVLALEWTGLRAPSILAAVLETNRARSVRDVAEAWRGTAGPYLHLVAADTGGHIAQFVSGLIPERPRGAGRLPAPGHDSRWAWGGMVEIPGSMRSLDPPEGFVAVANQDPFTEGDYRTHRPLAGEFAEPWRVRRIRGALAARSDWRPTDLLRLQGDIRSGLAVALLRELRPELEAHRGKAAAALAAWDGAMAHDSVAPHLYAQLRLELAQAIGGDEGAQAGLPRSPLTTSDVLRLLAGGMDEKWFDDNQTITVEDRAATVARALDRLERSGIHESWGEVHHVTFQHPLAALPVVGRWIGRSWSRGPYPIGGDGTTINAAYWSMRQPFAAVGVAAARVVVDVGSWDDAILVLPVGQSGRPWSAHYADQLEAWLHVEPIAFPFSREAVDAAAAARLTLLPAPAGG
jgi:penicillin amidase